MSQELSDEADVVCYRCDKPLPSLRYDVDGWRILDARDDGWVVAVCWDCQTPAEKRFTEEVRRST